MNTSKYIVTCFVHEHDFLISNSFYEQRTKTVRRQLEVCILKIYLLFVYMYMVTYTCFMHCNKLCACAQKLRRQRPLRWPLQRQRGRRQRKRWAIATAALGDAPTNVGAPVGALPTKELFLKKEKRKNMVVKNCLFFKGFFKK